MAGGGADRAGGGGAGQARAVQQAGQQEAAGGQPQQGENGLAVGEGLSENHGRNSLGHRQLALPGGRLIRYQGVSLFHDPRPDPNRTFLELPTEGATSKGQARRLTQRGFATASKPQAAIAHVARKKFLLRVRSAAGRRWCWYGTVPNTVRTPRSRRSPVMFPTTSVRRRNRRLNTRRRPQRELLEDRCVPAAGFPDPAFGAGGKVPVPFNAADKAAAVALDGQGRVPLAIPEIGLPGDPRPGPGQRRRRRPHPGRAPGSQGQKGFPPRTAPLSRRGTTASGAARPESAPRQNQTLRETWEVYHVPSAA